MVLSLVLMNTLNLPFCEPIMLKSVVVYLLTVPLLCFRIVWAIVQQNIFFCSYFTISVLLEEIRSAYLSQVEVWCRKLLEPSGRIKVSREILTRKTKISRIRNKEVPLSTACPQVSKSMPRHKRETSKKKLQCRWWIILYTWYVLSVMMTDCSSVNVNVQFQTKFVEAVLTSNSTDDHCREFIRQEGLKPLMEIFRLPNLPLEFPYSHACHSTYTLVKSVVVRKGCLGRYRQ